MPELPEVEVVRRGIEDWATKQRITGVEVIDTRSLRRHPQGPEHFTTALFNKVLAAPQRRGKYLWIPLLSTNQAPTHALVVHLGMSGQILVSTTDNPDQKHLKIRITLEDGELRFVDQRIFGGLYIDQLVQTPDAPHQLIPHSVTHIGRDPLDALFDTEVIFRALRSKKTNIKRALLDQNIASGIGNIYADEALWAAKLNYMRPTETLRRREIQSVYQAAQDVMNKALQQGGTSFDALYVNVNGESGYFDRSLNVYGRENQPCHRCLQQGKDTLIARRKFMNRSSYFCPVCQPVPRRRRE